MYMLSKGSSLCKRWPFIENPLRPPQIININEKHSFQFFFRRWRSIQQQPHEEKEKRTQNEIRNIHGNLFYSNYFDDL